MGDFSPLTESSPVRSLRSLPFPPLCSPNQEQLCSSTVVSHSLSGNLKAIKRAPRCYPTPFCICACVCMCVRLSRLSVCAHRDILCAPTCVHTQKSPNTSLVPFQTASVQPPSLVESPCFSATHFSGKKSSDSCAFRPQNTPNTLPRSSHKKRGGVCVCVCTEGEWR